jgi:apolipoprotein N-acyltransferase
MFFREAIAPKKLFLAVFLVWWIKYLAALSWYWDTYPLTWVDIGGPVVQLGVILFYWVTSALWLACGSIVLVYLLLRCRERIPVVALPAFVAGAWVVAEVVGAFLFSLVTYGDGGSISAAFSFGMVGYIAAHIPGGWFLAGAFGVYGLGIVCISIVVSLYLSMNRVPRMASWSATGVIIVICIGAALARPVIPLDTTVLTINTTISAAEQQNENGQAYKFSVLDEALARANDFSASVILLPEASQYFSSLGDGSYNNGIQRYRFGSGTSTHTVIDSGRVVINTDKAVLRAYEFNAETNTVSTADKQYLVPQGEFVPWLYGSIFRLLGYGEVITDLKAHLYVRGNDRHTQYPVLFCFESVNPIGVKKTITPGNSFVAHPISHAWFHEPTRLWAQLDTMLRVQARWSGVSIISAANVAPGKRYAGDGTVDGGEIVATGDAWEVRRYDPD